MGDVLSLSFFVPGRPVPFARAGANGKRRYTPPKQAAYMVEIASFAKEAMRGAGMSAPFGSDRPLEMRYRATYAIPTSWTKAQRAAAAAGAAWKLSVPDTDNLYKLAADALKDVVLTDDAAVARAIGEKVYGPVAGAQITLSVIPDTMAA